MREILVFPPAKLQTMAEMYKKVQDVGTSVVLETNNPDFALLLMQREREGGNVPTAMVVSELTEENRTALGTVFVGEKEFAVLGEVFTAPFYRLDNETVLTGIEHRFLKVENVIANGVALRRLGIASLLVDVLDFIEEEAPEFEYSRRPSRLAFQLNRGYVPVALIYKDEDEFVEEKLSKKDVNKLIQKIKEAIKEGKGDEDLGEPVIKMMNTHKRDS